MVPPAQLARRATGLAAIVLALGMILAAIAPVAMAGRPVGLSGTDRSPAGGFPGLASNVLPVAFGLPWSERVGFNASIVAQAENVAPATGTLSVELTLWPSNEGLFASRSAGAPALSNAQLAATYGTTPAQYAGLESYFVHRGLTLAQTSPVRLSLLVTGPAMAVGAAFGTELMQGQLGGRAVQFPDPVPSLPANLQNLVETVSGLGSGSTQFVLPLDVAGMSGGRTAAGSPSPISPNDAHVIYDLNSLYNYSGSSHWAVGQGIAVILWGSGYDPQDISTFFAQEYPSEFPTPKVVPYPVRGAPSPSASAVNDPSNSTQELTLDIEWSASEAPGATIDVVYAPDGPASDGYSPSDSDMEAAISEAINNIPGVGVISMSFGSLDGGDPSFESALSQDFALADQKHITVLAASGDNGGTVKGQSACSGGPAPQFPASSPWVLAVGGTAPVLSQSPFGTVTGLASEPAWGDSGGGYSPDLLAPSWEQVGSAAGPIAAHGGHRGIPDVAGPAAENLFYYDGVRDYGSGTSFATPMWAGIVAEMNAIRGAPLGFITDRVYQVASTQAGSGANGLADITDGATCLTSAGPGWDAATGWGSPRAGALYEHIAGTYVNVSLNTSTGSVPPGGSFSVRVVVTNATSELPIRGLAVQFDMDGSFPGPCTGTLATASNATTDSNGRTNATLTVPSCYLGSSVSILATVDSGGYLGSASASVGINLLGLAGLIAVSQTFPYNVLLFGAIMAVAIGIGLWFGRRRSPSRKAPMAAAATPPGAPSPPPSSPPASPRAAVSSPPPPNPEVDLSPRPSGVAGPPQNPEGGSSPNPSDPDRTSPEPSEVPQDPTSPSEPLGAGSRSPGPESP